MDYAELAERWSGFAAPAGIYRVDPDIEPLDDLFGLADRAGLDAAADRGFTEVGPLLEIERGAQVFTVYRPSRAVQWTDTERWQIDDGGASREISDDDAVAAAVDQVDRLELAGADVFAPRRVTRLRVATAERGGVPDDVRVVDVGVVLARVLDGLPVEGPGGNIVVYLDRERQLTGFERVARRIAGRPRAGPGLAAGRRRHRGDGGLLGPPARPRAERPRRPRRLRRARPARDPGVHPARLRPQPDAGQRGRRRVAHGRALRRSRHQQHRRPDAVRQRPGVRPPSLTGRRLELTEAMGDRVAATHGSDHPAPSI